MQRKLSLNFLINNVFGAGTLNKFAKKQGSELKVKVDTCSTKLFLVPLFVISVKTQ